MVVYIYNPNTLKTEKGLKFEASLGNSKILSKYAKTKNTYTQTSFFYVIRLSGVNKHIISK